MSDLPSPVPPFHFANFQLLETKLIWMQDRVLEKSHKTHAVTVEDIPVWFVRRGRLVLVMDGNRVQAEQGQWLLPKQGQGIVHTLPDSEILSFRFRLRWPNGQEAYRRRKTLCLEARKWELLTRAAMELLSLLGKGRFWYAEQWLPESGTDYFSLQSRFHVFLHAYCGVMEAHEQSLSITEEKNADVLEARRILMAWDLTRPFSRKGFSRKLGIGVQSLSRQFVAYFGVTPRAFLEQRKLEWARQRLAQGDERIKWIAAEIGFLSLPQFSNWFRLRNQVSPRVYRMLNRPTAP